MVAHSLTNTWYAMITCRTVKVQDSMKSSLPALVQSRAVSQSSGPSQLFCWDSDTMMDQPPLLSRLLHLSQGVTGWD